MKATLLPLHPSYNRVNTRSISGENTTSQIGFAIRLSASYSVALCAHGSNY